MFSSLQVLQEVRLRTNEASLRTDEASLRMDKIKAKKEEKVEHEALSAMSLLSLVW